MMPRSAQARAPGSRGLRNPSPCSTEVADLNDGCCEPWSREWGDAS